MSYWEWGDPNNAKVLLCVHGLLRTGRDFDALAQALSPYYRVVCPDIVGRGSSDWLLDPTYYTVPQYVADIFTLLARLQPEVLDWFGTSMGGLIGLGLNYALQSAPHNPIPLRKMVLNDVGPELNPQGLVRIGQYVGEPLVFDTFEQAVEQAKQRWAAFGEHTQAQWEHLARYVFQEKAGRWQQAYDLRIAVPFQQQFAAPNTLNDAVLEQTTQLLWQAYRSLPDQVLIVRGQQSDLLSEQRAEKMLAQHPQAQLYEVAQVGHAPTFMQADQQQRLQQFLLQG